MTPELIFENLQSWALQVLVIIAVCGPMPLLLRLRVPRPRLAYFQGILLVCAALPLLQPWRSKLMLVPQPSVAATTAQALRIPIPATPPAPEPLNWNHIALSIVVAGAAARLLLLGLGFARLRWLRRTATPLEITGARFENTPVDLAISPSISGAVTFGYRRPVVLLPPSFTQMNQETRNAILCHELLHVERRDWPVMVVEEIVASVLWFHPAVWWLLGRIRLSREQVVDHEVVQRLGERDRYVQALISVASGCATVDLTPAMPFLRRRNLLLRVSSLILEASMSRRHLAAALAVSISMLLLVVWLATTTLPLHAAPQIQAISSQPDLNVTAEPGTLKLLHRPGLRYPAEARAKKIRGTVTLDLSVDANGNVIDARVLSGPEELRKAALQSVLEWHYSKPGAPTTVQANLTYEPPPDPPEGTKIDRMPSAVFHTSPARQLAGIQYRVPDSIKDELEPALREFIGKNIDGNLLRDVQQKVSAVEPHAFIMWNADGLIVSMRDSPGGVIDKIIGATPRPPTAGVEQQGGVIGGIIGGTPRPPTPGSEQPAMSRQIRIGGNVQAAKLVTSARPEYPPLAQQARIQGIVRFNVTIGEDGRVKNVQLESGHPLLVQSALEAVNRYEYQPTLLNGAPVEVVTVVDVPFALN